MRRLSAIMSAFALVAGLGASLPAAAASSPEPVDPVVASAGADAEASAPAPGDASDGSGNGEGAADAPADSGSQEGPEGVAPESEDTTPASPEGQPDSEPSEAALADGEDAEPSVVPTGTPEAEEHAHGADSNADPDAGRSLPSPDAAGDAQQTVGVYRLYNPRSGEHFYTADGGEKNNLVSRGWYDEGTAWFAVTGSKAPVYRMHNPASGEHHYTTDANERKVLVSRGWRAEGVLCYASEGGAGVEVYRQFNSRASVGAHNFTTSKQENDNLVRSGWKGEGVAFRVAALGVPKAWPAGAPSLVTPQNVYRLYHGATGEHFYTTSASEQAALVRSGWFDEGTGWVSPSWSRNPVYRLYNPRLRDHHYTTDANEVRVLTSRHGWRNEGVGWYSSEAREVQVYRQFNPRLVQGAHHYTTNRGEYDANNARNGWRGEGIAWYAIAPGVPKAHPPASMDEVLAGLTDPQARAMAVKAQSYSSSSNWLILINQDAARVGIFQRRNGRWFLRNFWLAGPGAPSTPTIKGVFSIGNRGYSFGKGYTAYYWTQFSGDYLFHSILYYEGTRTVKDATLGRKVSHGCVRLAIENAKWINENIPRGTTVVSY